MRLAIGFVAGLLFGLGLIVGGMTDPARVLGFLDLAGAGDPSLVFVMLGAVVTTALGYRLVLARAHPLCDTVFHLPAARQVDRRLLLGSALFGMGWGLAGYCPGPVIASLASLQGGVWVMFASMLAGWLLVDRAAAAS